MLATQTCPRAPRSLCGISEHGPGRPEPSPQSTRRPADRYVQFACSNLPASRHGTRGHGAPSPGLSPKSGGEVTGRSWNAQRRSAPPDPSPLPKPDTTGGVYRTVSKRRRGLTAAGLQRGSRRSGRSRHKRARPNGFLRQEGAASSAPTSRRASFGRKSGKMCLPYPHGTAAWAPLSGSGEGAGGRAGGGTSANLGADNACAQSARCARIANKRKRGAGFRVQGSGFRNRVSQGVMR
jgi:hypothetical protein